LSRNLVGHAHLRHVGSGSVPMANRLLRWLNAYTIILVTKRLIWDEAKRAANLVKHGLDFADAGEVLESQYRLDIAEMRDNELRTQSFSYVMNCLRVLTVVHIDRDDATRVISYRRASTAEREAYYEWTES
jgi:uncharacterized protein